MGISHKQFRDWGAEGGRIGQRRLLKARHNRLKRLEFPLKTMPPKRGRPTNKVVNERATSMMEMWRKGNSLESIGIKHNITRERVRQLIAKYHPGINITVKSARNAERRRKEEEVRKQNSQYRAVSVYGVSEYELREIQGNRKMSDTKGPALIYRQKQNDAKIRNIPWEFTLKTWFDTWQNSGKWPERGRGSKRFCMSRVGDIGPYSPSNARIITNSQNARESFYHVDGATRFSRTIMDAGSPGLLSPRQKEAWDLREEGLSLREMAEKMSIEKTTISTMLCAARRKLGIISNEE
jgi:DNA-binding CsgD family transcriptional regulator